VAMWFGVGNNMVFGGVDLLRSGLLSLQAAVGVSRRQCFPVRWSLRMDPPILGHGVSE